MSARLFVLMGEHWTISTSSALPLAISEDDAALRAASIELARERWKDVPADLDPALVWSSDLLGWAYLGDDRVGGIQFRLIPARVIGDDYVSAD